MSKSSREETQKAQNPGQVGPGIRVNFATYVSAVLLTRQDQISGFAQVAGSKIWRLAKFLGVTAIDKDGATPGGMTAVNVTPSVANHPAAL